MSHVKKVLFFCLISIFVLTGCAGQTQREKEEFDAQLAHVEKEEKVFNETLNRMALDKMKKWVEDDVTDSHKEKLQGVEKKIQEQLKPKFKAYQKEVNALPDTNKDLKSVKQAYLKSVQGKEREIERLEQFITQYIASLETNENILNYTQSFESHRAQVEALIAEAQTSEKGVKEVTDLEELLQKNNDDIKKSVEAVTEKNEADVFKNQTIPLIQKQIRTLNQKQLHNQAVSQARQNAIEMYHNLERYYEERVKAIEYSESLKQIDVNTLPLTSKDLSHYNDASRDAYKKLSD
ncbi:MULTISPECIES: EMYY motif lipoprotein [unclassified Staphylococcus]|uniref:EMYY motif lipoprotein n=1 Tax=unclassified Staphylococcus TaxID=91994 RepID=UPI0021D0D46D|nr:MULTISPECIES: EMYY motif lipoprotein [unclassified Staphylococcus]UXR72024.1 EMYY motif lipoprotein [Staphylococcus sp. IVB6240]UXR74332.1 EMYY motif lipoprotein [Staphylococcus sp. IVB6238]UXR76718.1 EMYY motif lipoprotein [Staphylococcus sp. IVB6233]UXR80847.1 EMYY motif lipoprotein [Staphylococcus sp. IVB6218]